MNSSIASVLSTFRKNNQSVQSLLTFDHAILDVATVNLRSMSAELKADGKFALARRIENRVAALEAIHEHDSLRLQYKQIYNQCVVLLVSYFASALHDLFRFAVSHALRERIDVPVTKEEVKLTWTDLGEDPEDSYSIFADLLISQKDISFQDMKSISRGFKSFFDVTILKDNVVNDIILGQAARHVIVHSGAIVDRRMLNQLRSASPRMMKPALSIDEKLEFTPEEVNHLMAAMEKYVDALSVKLSESLNFSISV